MQNYMLPQIHFYFSKMQVSLYSYLTKAAFRLLHHRLVSSGAGKIDKYKEKAT